MTSPSKLVGPAALAALIATACPSVAPAQTISYTSTSSAVYTENFDSLAASGTGNVWSNGLTITGFHVYKAGSAGTTGARDATITAQTTYNADTGASNTGTLYSYGAAGAAERALGDIGSGTPGDFIIAAIIQNNTGSTITGFTLTYDGEQWRNGGNATMAAQSMVFDFAAFAVLPVAADLSATNTSPYTADSLLDFTSTVNGATAGAVDGNGAGLTANISATESLSIPNGSYLVLRWWDDNHPGNDHGLALDNFRFSAAIPAPGALALLGFGGLCVARRARRS